MKGPTACKGKEIGRTHSLCNDSWYNVLRTLTTGEDKRDLTGIYCSCHSRTAGVRRRDYVLGKLTLDRVLIQTTNQTVTRVQSLTTLVEFQEKGLQV